MADEKRNEVSPVLLIKIMVDDVRSRHCDQIKGDEATTVAYNDIYGAFI